jgi:class 3 adenylate cyclase
MGTQVLIGEATYQKVKHRILCEPMGKPELKGKEKEVSLYNAIRVLKSRE